LNLREQRELFEEKYLSIYAAKSRESKGRNIEIAPCIIRTCYQRDRDRILHSKAFRRLKHKTQVFISPAGDHYRTRLTHTLEVSQIARTIARGLKLNEDLTEAISLGHDLGHTPFGHAGEDIINEIAPFNFTHNENSLRVVEKLEGNNGLNLTYEVRDGIINHKGGMNANTLEGKIVHLSDRIAYINHDIDDAVRAGILSEDSIPKELTTILGNSHGERIQIMIMDIIDNSMDREVIIRSNEIEQATDELRNYLFKNVYKLPSILKENNKAQHIVRELYYYYINNPVELPDDYQNTVVNEGIERAVVDYISCMSDNFITETFRNLFIPKIFI
jgi:dGTPase